MADTDTEVLEPEDKPPSRNDVEAPESEPDAKAEKPKKK